MTTKTVLTQSENILSNFRQSIAAGFGQGQETANPGAEAGVSKA